MDKGSFITVTEVAGYLKVSVQYVRSLIRNNHIQAQRFGNQWLTTKEEVAQYLKKSNTLIEPDDHKRRSKKLPPIVALSFFSGAMGLDIGMANVGIPALLACEFNKYCRLTIERNKPEIALIGDIGKYSAKDVLDYAGISRGTPIDVVFGGPPCQAFSTAGRRKGFEDERGNVFLKYLELIGELLPTYVVVENVRGLLSAAYPYGNLEEPVNGGALAVVLDKLRNYGYTPTFNLYNAANFGAPQIRERIVIIAKRGKSRVAYLQPTHSENEEWNLPKWKTLRDAFQKLPSDVVHHYIKFPEKRLIYYRMLSEGQYWKNLPLELQKQALGASFNLGGGKTGFLRRLTYKRPSPTLVTNPTMPATDLAHPVEDRPLSVEEYACIQEFPCDWEICGPILEQYKQIGNAVPIKLGEAIGRTILDDMNGTQSPKTSGFEYSRYKNTDDISWERETQKRFAVLRQEKKQRLLF